MPHMEFSLRDLNNPKNVPANPRHYYWWKLDAARFRSHLTPEYSLAIRAGRENSVTGALVSEVHNCVGSSSAAKPNLVILFQTSRAVSQSRCCSELAKSAGRTSGRFEARLSDCLISDIDCDGLVAFFRRASPLSQCGQGLLGKSVAVCSSTS